MTAVIVAGAFVLLFMAASYYWPLLGRLLFGAGGRLLVETLDPGLIVIREEGWGNPTSILVRDGMNRRAILVSPGTGSWLFPLHWSRDRAFRRILREWNGANISMVWVINAYPTFVGNAGITPMLNRLVRVVVQRRERAVLLDMNQFVRRMEECAQATGGHFREHPWVRKIYWLWPLYRRHFYGSGPRFQEKQLSDPPTEPFLWGRWKATPWLCWGDGGQQLCLIFEHSENGKKVGIIGDVIPPKRGRARDNLAVAYLPGSNPFGNVASLRELLTHNLDVLIPVHGAPIIGKERVRERIEEVIAATDAVNAMIRKLHHRYPEWPAEKLADVAFEACEYPDSRLFGENERQTWVRAVISGRTVPSAVDESAVCL